MKYIVQIEIDPHPVPPSKPTPRSSSPSLVSGRLSTPSACTSRLPAEPSPSSSTFPTKTVCSKPCMRPGWPLTITPDVSPVADSEAFPQLLQRAGIGG